MARQRGTVKVFVVTGLVVVALILWKFALPKREYGSPPMCISSLKQAAIGLLMYAEDNGAMPPRDIWMDVSAGRRRHPDLVRCPKAIPPDEADLYKKKPSPYYGYAMNATLASKPRDTEDGDMPPLVYDSLNLARNASDLATSLPSPGRHRGRNNISYEDGHTKSVPEPVVR